MKEIVIFQDVLAYPMFKCAPFCTI